MGPLGSFPIEQCLFVKKRAKGFNHFRSIHFACHKLWYVVLCNWRISKNGSYVARGDPVTNCTMSLEYSTMLWEI
jgi:hypothetical protein